MKTMVKFLLVIVLVGSQNMMAAGDGLKEMKNMITEKEVMEAQKQWGDGIVRIGSEYLKDGDYVQAAEKHIKTLYAYGMTDVLFKPTKAADKQFRTDYEGALSYFVGDNKKYGEDSGFAINPWTKVRFENVKTFIHGNTALAMGNYYFTTTGGDVVKVEYSFGYVKDKDNNLKIVLHHSSLPFQK